MEDLTEHWCLIKYFTENKNYEIFGKDEVYNNKLIVPLTHSMNKEQGEYLYFDLINKYSENKSWKREHIMKSSLDFINFNAEHLPRIKSGGFSLCLSPGCKQKTKVICCSCNIPLCLSNRKNCFLDFHS